MMRNNILRQYTENGISITVYKPRMTKEQRTWVPFAKYSVANMGHQASAIGSRKCLVAIGSAFK
jgi:hypothetical protein